MEIISPSSTRIPDLFPSAVVLSHAGAQCCSIPIVTLTLTSAFSHAWVTSHLDGYLSTFFIIQFSVSFERVFLFVCLFGFIFHFQMCYFMPCHSDSLLYLLLGTQPYLHGLMTLSLAPASLNSTTNYKHLKFKRP